MSSSLVIVALPAEDDVVWKVSSEKIPHLTLLYLGELTDAHAANRMAEFVEHALTFKERGPFYLDVDHRGELGDDKADVLFFEHGWDTKHIKELRAQLLQHSDIRTAYEAQEQFPEWVPHLTLGYPDSPAKPLPNDRRIHSVSFDRVAVWMGDYEGPEFRLKWPERESELAVAYSDTGKNAVEELLHYGVKGMKWGVRRSDLQKKAHERRVSTEAANREKRPEREVRVYDTIGPSKRTKAKVETKGGEDVRPVDDAIKVAIAQQKLKKSGPAALTNQELREVATRLQLEQQVNQLTGGKGRNSLGKKFVDQHLVNNPKNQKKLIDAGAKQIIKKAAKGAAVAAI